MPPPVQQCSSVLQDNRLPTAPCGAAVCRKRSNARYLCNAALYHGSPTTHCPVKCNGVPRDFHCPLPHAVWYCAAGVPLPTALCTKAVYRKSSIACGGLAVYC